MKNDWLPTLGSGDEKSDDLLGHNLGKLGLHSFHNSYTFVPFLLLPNDKLIFVQSMRDYVGHQIHYSKLILEMELMKKIVLESSHSCLVICVGIGIQFIETKVVSKLIKAHIVFPFINKCY